MKNILDGLNKPQLRAVTSEALVNLCLAGAGSGKTRVLTNRVAYLHKEKRIGTTNMICLTFTRLAAKEMKERVMKLIGEVQGKKLWAGTFHAFAAGVLWRWGHKLGIDPGYTIYDQEDRADIMQAIINDLKPRTTLKKIMERFDNCRDVNEEKVNFPEECRVLLEYGYRLRQNNAVDIDRMIDLVVRLWTICPEALEEYRRNYTHVFIDEFQDTSDDQMEMIRLLDPEHLFVVGDDFQCQPPGTLVNTPKGVVPIEELLNGDEVLAWNRKSQYVSGTGYKIKVAERPYTGDLIKISANGASTRTTPNHKFLVRWINRDASIFVTYLMFRRDRGYRVGWCQLFCRNKGVTHVAQRARLEKADALWILGIHANKRDATVQESIISFKYGIPTCMFEPNGELYNEDALFRIFANARPGGAEECFRDYGLHQSLPFWPYPNKRDNSGRPTYFECYACNILPEYMSIPLPGSKEHLNQWAVITSKDREHYSGLVYSLDVETHHNYVADGLVTLNSIYGWRKARVEYILNFHRENPDCEVIKLEDNYRSTRQIIQAANNLIRHNTRQTKKTLIAHKEGPPIDYNLAVDEMQECLMIGKFIQVAKPEKYSNIAVLARTNAMVEKIETVLRSMDIPVQRLGGGEDVFKAPGVSGILNWMNLVQNKKDNMTLRKCLSFYSKVNNDLQMKQLELEALSNDKTLFETMVENCASNPGHFSETFIGKVNEIEKVLTDQEIWTPSQCFLIVDQLIGTSEIYRKAGLKNKLEDMQKAVVAMQKWEESKAAMGELRSTQAFLKWLRYRDMHEKLIQENQDAVKVATVHASKGLEFPVVILAGMNQDTFPSRRGDPEEERRLCYVAITRAKDMLMITRSDTYQDFKGCPNQAEESQYIREMV